MNKKLFETRVNSVNHYVQEIENLEQAKRVTEATLKELIASFKEFVPYKKGDVLLVRDRVFKVARIDYMSRDGKVVLVRLIIHNPNSSGGYQNSEDHAYIRLSEIDNIKILFSEPEESA